MDAAFGQYCDRASRWWQSWPPWMPAGGYEAASRAVTRQPAPTDAGQATSLAACTTPQVVGSHGCRLGRAAQLRSSPQ